MKIGCTQKCILVASLGLCGITSSGHEVVVHRRITENASASALADSSAYLSLVDTVSTDCSYEAALAAMVLGSEREDDTGRDAGGKRAYNHFYDPLTGQGLSDYPPDRRLLTGTNSFAWASVRNCRGLDFAPFSLFYLWSFKPPRKSELP